MTIAKLNRNGFKNRAVRRQKLNEKDVFLRLILRERARERDSVRERE